MKNNSKKLFALAAAAALCAPAMAKESEPGFYVAPEISLVSFSDYCSDARTLFNVTSCEDSEIGFGISGGYQFNPFFAAELGARFGSGYDVTVTNDLGAALSIDIDYTSFSLGGRGNYPIGTSGLALTGNLGFHFWDVEASAGGASISTDGTDPYGGIGASYAFSDSISARGEYTYYKYDDDNANVFSGAVVWNF